MSALQEKKQQPETKSNFRLISRATSSELFPNQIIEMAVQKQEANRIKQIIKNNCKLQDLNGTELIDWNLFQQLLKSQGVRLSPQDLKKIKKHTLVDTSKNLLNFKKALRMISPDMQSQDPLLKEWVVLVNPENKNRQANSSTSSMLGTLHGDDFKLNTNQQLKYLNSNIRYVPKISRNIEHLNLTEVDERGEIELPSQGLKNFEQDAYMSVNYSKIPLIKSLQEATWFDGKSKQDFVQRYASNDTSIKTQTYENTFSVSNIKNEHTQHIKNKKDFDILSNLYKGQILPNLPPKTERQKEERPGAMRPEVVNTYIQSVLDIGAKHVNDIREVKSKNWVKIIEQIYKLNLDNRILNNLREQLNELIEDEKGYVSPQIFKQLFFTYFKGERYAYFVYDMLIPLVTKFYDDESATVLEENDPRCNENNRVVVIQQLTKFIDMFNYYPIKISKLKYKNDSNEFTYIMSSGMHGSKNERGEVEFKETQKKTEEELYLIKLLALVSGKINERFLNLQQCFRFLDKNHSQSISINEFSQAIDHMRLKISFEDIKRLFNYMDKEKKGELNYEDFTMLLEERWRGIDPVAMRIQNSQQLNQTLQNRKKTLPVFKEGCKTEQEVFQKLEDLATNKIKLNLQNTEKKTIKITRSSANNYLSETKTIPMQGKPAYQYHDMEDILKHKYLKKSIEHRIQRKAILREYQNQISDYVRINSVKQTGARKIRSQSLLSNYDKSPSGQKKTERTDNGSIQRSASLYSINEDQKQSKIQIDLLKRASQKMFNRAQICEPDQAMNLPNPSEKIFHASKSQFSILQDKIVQQSVQSLTEEGNNTIRAPTIQKMTKSEVQNALSTFYENKKQLIDHRNSKGVYLVKK